MSTQRWIARVEVANNSPFASTTLWRKSNKSFDEVLHEERVVVDAKLGFAIGTSDPSSGAWPSGIKVLSAVRDVEFRLARSQPRVRPVRWLKSAWAPQVRMPQALRAAMKSPLPYGVWRLGDWSTYTGDQVCVAVLDSGIGFGIPALPRRPNHSDFHSAELPGTTNDMGCHGTNCAGVIGAHAVGGDRCSVAPDCTLFAGQVTCLPRPGGTYTSIGHILDMASWAVENGARILNLSLCADQERDLTPAHAQTFGDIVSKMRTDDVALVFAVAEEGTSRLIFPADAPGVVAVGKHARTVYGTEYVYGVKTPALWHGKSGDLLFGPGEVMPTFNPDGSPAMAFDGTSCACAFVSGVAALYMQKYPGDSVDDILVRMRNDAVPLVGARSTLTWPCVRFP